MTMSLNTFKSLLTSITYYSNIPFQITCNSIESLEFTSVSFLLALSKMFIHFSTTKRFRFWYLPQKEYIYYKNTQNKQQESPLRDQKNGEQGWRSGSVLQPGVICGLSFVIGSPFAPRGFSPGTSVYPSPQIWTTFLNSISMWNARTRINESRCTSILSRKYYLFAVLSLTSLNTRFSLSSLNAKQNISETIRSKSKCL